MSRNAPREITADEFEEAIKTIKRNYVQFTNGYTITRSDYTQTVEALRNLKRLPALIEYYVGLEDEDI